MRLPFLTNLFGGPRTHSADTRQAVPDADRFREYVRYLRAYRGFRSRVSTATSTTTAERAAQSLQRVRHNFNKPVVNLGAAFMAAKPLRWKVDGNTAATQAAFEIWDRSGSERALLSAARCCAIYGDLVAIAAQDEQGRPRLEFVCPDICFPHFRGNDAAKLEELDITWEEEDRQERRTQHREFYTEAGREVYLNGKRDTSQDQAWERLPAAWLRNLSVMGLSYGISDLEDVADLVDEYDHLARKRSQTIDYYAQPNIVAEGMDPGDIAKNTGTIFYTPPGSKMYFLEWHGTPPDVEQQLTRIRNDLSEVAQVPAVAFGRQDSGFSNISGVALRILYGPLLAKTGDKRGNWSPELEYLMWLCLRAEGHAVDPEAVNAVWQEPLPEDALERVQEEDQAVKAGLRSIETAMQRLGTEDVRQERRRVDRDRRLDTLERLAGAGVGVREAALTAGYSEEEAETLAGAMEEAEAEVPDEAQEPQAE